MKWRVAKSLDILLKQLNSAYPNRSKASDGSIGDTAHSARKSDHNPNAAGVVQARDFTHDPANGLDCNKLADTLMASRDPRIKYLIWNRRISSDIKAGTWKKYTGGNPHDKHLHISVNNSPAHYDDAAEWNLESIADSAVKAMLVLKIGDSGDAVIELQKALRRENSLFESKVDGIFGNGTKQAVIAYQIKQGLKADGIVGDSTRKLLAI